MINCISCKKDLEKEYYYDSNLKNKYYVCKLCFSEKRKQKYKPKPRTNYKIRDIKNKHCNNCKMIKCVSEFYKDSSKRGLGYSSRCKECITTHRKKPQIKEKRNKQRRKFLKENPNLRIKNNLCVRINGLLKGSWESKTLYRYLGISYPKFIKWIEFQFDSKMSFENYGTYWHIDHTIPCDNYDFSDKENFKICFNWKNLRPLEKIENLKKSSKIIHFEILKQEIKAYYFKNTFLDNNSKLLELQLPLHGRNSMQGTRLMAVPNGNNVEDWAIRS